MIMLFSTEFPAPENFGPWWESHEGCGGESGLCGKQEMPPCAFHPGFLICEEGGRLNLLSAGISCQKNT